MSIPSWTNQQFTRVVDGFRSMPWHADIHVEEIGSPPRIAPQSLAVAAEYIELGVVLASGRIIVLHDPAGNEAWDSTFRVVSYARADMDLDIVADPMLPDVAWSWMCDALDDHGAGYSLLAGTVTASYGRAFGQMEGQEDQADVEIRSSWTPELSNPADIHRHLAAWQDLLSHVAGRPPLPSGIVRFPGGQ